MNGPTRKLCQSGLAFLPIAILVSALPSCGGTTGMDTAQSGGSPASGGQTTGTGGAAPSGGAPGSGATPGTGGAPASGGAAPSGGSSGSSAGGGGNSSTGGAAAGGGAPGVGGSQGGGGTAPAECLLPADTGPCDAAIVQFAYDSASGLCLPFSYGGCEGNANRFASLEACDAACRGGSPTPLDSCTSPLDCRLANFDCCGPCEPIELSQLEAVDQRFLWIKEQARQLECGSVSCGACAEGDPVSQNYGVACENKTCVGFDVRERADLSACEQDTDCRLREGLTCCEACGGGDWIAVTTQGTGVLDVLCGGAPPPCAACGGTVPPNLVARCVAKICQVVQL